jgi:hypothetical protein
VRLKKQKSKNKKNPGVNLLPTHGHNPALLKLRNLLKPLGNHLNSKKPQQPGTQFKLRPLKLRIPSKQLIRENL